MDGGLKLNSRLSSALVVCVCMMLTTIYCWRSPREEIICNPNIRFAKLCFKLIDYKLNCQWDGTRTKEQTNNQWTLSRFQSHEWARQLHGSLSGGVGRRFNWEFRFQFKGHSSTNWDINIDGGGSALVGDAHRMICICWWSSDVGASPWIKYHHILG